MADLERVTKGLECCIKRDPDDKTTCGECPYEGACLNRLKSDALALLKAQQPRVLTLEEVKQHNNQDGCVWFEQPTYNAYAAFVRKEDFEIEVISPYLLGTPINHDYWLDNNYNITWRCWNVRPTPEQREAMKWNE